MGGLRLKKLCDRLGVREQVEGVFERCQFFRTDQYGGWSPIPCDCDAVVRELDPVEGCVISSTTERPPTPSTRRQIDDNSPQVDTAVVDRTFPPLRQRSGDRLSDEIFGGTRIADECSCEPLHTRTLRQSS